MAIIQTIKEDLRAAFKNGNTLIQLIVINVFIFLALHFFRLILSTTTSQHGLTESLSFKSILSYIAMPLNAIEFAHKPYTILSYQFIHIDTIHLLSNMVFMYFFGSILESYLGNKKTLSLYLFGGIVGGCCSMLICTFIPNSDSSLPLIGASASIAAIAVAAAAAHPRHIVRMMLFGEVPLYILVLIFLLINIISVTSFLNLSASLSHLGGAAFGYFFMYQAKKGNDLSTWLTKLLAGLKNLFSKQKLKVSHLNLHKKEDTLNHRKGNEKIELILTKIKRSGYDSLTKDEKDYLFQYNKD